MITRDEGGGGSAAGASSGEEAIALRRSLIIVSSVLGTTIIAILAVVAAVVLRRRRRRQRAYDVARARDPYLTRPEYDDRRRRLRWLTSPSPYQSSDRHGSRRSGGCGGIDVEAQRSEMIRKSLQSRSMVHITNQSQNQDAPPTPSIPQPFASTAGPDAATTMTTTTEILAAAPKPVRTRSRTWHGGRLSNDDDNGHDDDDQGDEDSGGGSNRGSGAASDDNDVRSAQARVDYMWELLNRKGGYSSSSLSPAAAAGGEDDDDNDSTPRPPTVRLKTPPLLSHPAFRNWGGAGSGGEDSGSRTPKHTSLPTELMAMRPSPL
ncbi:hypothetical protein MAPG_08148 [Magnaporthiopsis poae ATCC 64411]|uniref:Uncharacterized protein n=1 Tax=Magnaporthiopsis poae (strain ATCC 64411 / 73-15) TaxID=644358 RepID=A0A0C4E6K5_MAGP6|nr:hypothetical protein MAPG_08148 [Magnaporthiopsis poae ATCC 64411]